MQLFRRRLPKTTDWPSYLENLEASDYVSRSSTCGSLADLIHLVISFFRAMMSTSGTPQSAPAFETNQCTSFNGKENPVNSSSWDRLVLDRIVHGEKQLEPE